MIFVKNDSYIFQTGIPAEFKALLSSLCNEDKTAILQKFPEEDRETMCNFLGDITGEDWSTHLAALCEQSTKSVLETPTPTSHQILRQIHENAGQLKDIRWKRHIESHPRSFIVLECLTTGMRVSTLIERLNVLNYNEFQQLDKGTTKQSMTGFSHGNHIHYPIDLDKALRALREVAPLVRTKYS